MPSQKSFASKKLTENYIAAYKNIAISEMKRTGIPASIKLAQGLLESDLGRSPLAFKANNHFGIKCGKDWAGDVYYKLDDDTDSIGMLIESCFRAYTNAEESYIAHSEFLTNPSKQSRYGFLFDLHSTDYVGWANGLKFSGYATDPMYPSKLIKIIESNKLHLYDEAINIKDKEYTSINPSHNSKPNAKNKEPQIVKADQKIDIVSKKHQHIDTVKDKEKEHKKVNSKYGAINDLRMVYASGNESVKDIARRTGLDAFEILEYNEELKSLDYVPENLEIVYLERKKKNIKENGISSHMVNEGETMYLISQRYGIRLESLLAKNNLSKDAIPLKGETISLVAHVSKKDTPRFRIVEKFDSYVDLGELK